MAEIFEEAVMSGVLRGVEVAVSGGLLTADEVMSMGEVLPPARDIAYTLVSEAPDGAMPPWRQVITGEVVGTAVAARTMAGTLNELPIDGLRAVFGSLWDIIDRW